MYYITKNNLTKQVQGLSFDFKARHLEELAIEKSMGAYVNDYNLLIINRENIINNKPNQSKRVSNYLLLCTIFHELTHANQYYKINNTNGIENELYAKSFEAIMKDSFLYQRNHDLYPVEYNANIMSQIETTKLFLDCGIFLESNLEPVAQKINYLINNYYKYDVLQYIADITGDQTLIAKYDEYLIYPIDVGKKTR